MTALNWWIHVDFHFHYLSWSLILVICIENKTKQKGKRVGIRGLEMFVLSENLTCFVFLKHPFRDSPFCLITDEIIVEINERRIFYLIRFTEDEILGLIHTKHPF